MHTSQMRELERQHNVVTYKHASPNEIWEEKVGYDSANKRMIAKVYKHLYTVMELVTKPTWVMVIREMLIEDNRLNEVNIYGYYGTICKILKDIKVIRYEGRKLVKGENWDRFYSDEDWSWFITSTWAGGYGKIVK